MPGTQQRAQASVVVEERLRVVIDARVADEDISGSVCREFGDPKPFQGWLELLTALDGLLGGSTSSTWERKS